MKKKWMYLLGILLVNAYLIKKIEMQRGYKAIGGEWLILILIFIIYLLISWLKKDILDATTKQ